MCKITDKEELKNLVLVYSQATSQLILIFSIQLMNNLRILLLRINICLMLNELVSGLSFFMNNVHQILHKNTCIVSFTWE